MAADMTLRRLWHALFGRGPHWTYVGERQVVAESGEDGVNDEWIRRHILDLPSVDVVPHYFAEDDCWYDAIRPRFWSIFPAKVVVDSFVESVATYKDFTGGIGINLASDTGKVNISGFQSLP